MERRNSSLGCVIGGLGIVLAICLLPYLASSVYSIVGSVLGTPAPVWLWGEAANRLAGESDLLYTFVAEGPICCVGTLTLLIMVLGVVLMVNGRSRPAPELFEEPPDEELPYAEPPLS